MSIPGQIISASSNIQSAMAMIVDYLDSTYALQAADTLLEQGITNEEAKAVQDFEAKMNSATGPGNYIYQLKQPGADVSRITSEYQDANMQNQALTKVMDGNNSTAQNTLSQNSQGQQGLMQTMSAINQQQANLARDIQG
jgi:hypothetical protein